ncbi:uracil phosphoribosyltransferase-domain-containing protein [Lentinula aciculospora]|uniref:Uracil phosphoribosyltransferase-domain-containing protein n=1 Tax=Lentinula aciculospora TaxID=153920 RepID=A0A9W8ZV51_9AGAR|nr:uracil phosphoribosyltransferase-domain-containing protein [Lentinula aciculospora]
MFSLAGSETPSTVNKPTSMPQRPTVVGLYGLPGCGKSTLLDQLKDELGEQEFQYYEGTIMISSLVPGGLHAFQKMERQEKTYWREMAIKKIQGECSVSGRAAVVVGHFMFWDEKDEVGQVVWTQCDQETFTHILYLDISAQDITLRRQNDIKRARSSVSEEHLRKWKRAERHQLRLLCLKHRILFSAVAPDKVAMLLRKFREYTEQQNLSRAERTLDETFHELSGRTKLESMLVVDGDRTLISEDTGVLFWKLLADRTPNENTRSEGDPLKELFSSSFGYTHAAFCQAALLYESIPEEQFNEYCDEVAFSVNIHPEIVSLLKQTAERPVATVVVTCGLRLIWEKILQKAGLSKMVKVIGGGCARDGLIITDQVKATLVARLRDIHCTYVCAFGDSVLDLPMLKEAHQAIVVVGKHRSRRMEAALLDAIDHGGLRAWQVLLPSTTSLVPQFNTAKLPSVNITDAQFMNSVIFHCNPRVLHPDEHTAKLLMTPTRDAGVSGPALREAHNRVGFYLATEFLPKLIGLEEYLIPHVQGTRTNGYRILHEKKTLIIALMRGGEPMALGVNDALPLASFLHAKHSEDVELRHVQGQETVIVVDSVVNSGKTVAEFVQRIRDLHATIRILVVAGVIQANALDPNGALTQTSTMDVSFIALRLSDNKYTGKGSTDTGNRLFNTTDLQ